MQIQVLTDADAVPREAAKVIAAEARAAVAARGRFVMAVSGGKTSWQMLRTLAKENVLLVGNAGTGKTHLTTAPGFAACSQGKRVRSYTTTGLGTELDHLPRNQFTAGRGCTFRPPPGTLFDCRLQLGSIQRQQPKTKRKHKP